jgi:hypothetical protein
MNKPLIEYRISDFEEAKSRGYGLHAETIFPQVEVGDIVTFLSTSEYYGGGLIGEMQTKEIVGISKCAFSKDPFYPKNCQFCPGYICVKNSTQNIFMCMGVQDEWTIITSLKKCNSNEKISVSSYLLNNKDFEL